MSKRKLDRAANELRPIKMTAGYSRNAEGSCLIEYGYTKVLCTASISEKVPPFLRNTGKGWITAEYGMLPRSTGTRNQREAVKGKQVGRTQEIQRLIGRSLRAICDLEKLGERQIIIDCDVIEADGGTRTASITGAYIALYQACNHLFNKGEIKEFPIKNQVVAISCGIVNNKLLLDLDYEEDSVAEVDANFVFSEDGNLIEIQGTAEGRTFSDKELFLLVELAKTASSELINIQKNIINNL